MCYNGSMSEKVSPKELLERIKGEKAAAFEEFSALLKEYNQKFNLTSILEEREILYKHFLDSAAGESFFPAGARAAEVGSGAGFPSIPLMILRPDLSFCLFESVKKKCDFLSIAVKRLHLSAEIYPMRAEEAARDARFRETFDVCCARAVAELRTLSEYCLPLVRCGGRFLAYKSRSEEIEHSLRAVSLLGGKIEQVSSFSLPEGFGERTLISIKKVKPVSAKYPRGNGKERKFPL